MQDNTLRFQNISKRFGHVKALDDVTFSLEFGHIHGIVGENGAGKTTLMNVVYGLYNWDEGYIRYKGNQYNPTSPHVAIKSGINMVHQHFMLVDAYTVLENVLLGAEGGFFSTKYIKKARKRLEEICQSANIHLPLNKEVRDLSVGERQGVEILKALYRKARFLILDEPTAVLTPAQIKGLFHTLENLCSQGVTIILITHKLKEVKAVTDYVTVMRDGKYVGQSPTKEISISEMAKMIVGRQIQFGRINRPATTKNIKNSLEFNDVTYKDVDGIERLNHVSLTVHRGEIVGIAGVSGNGQTELAAVASDVFKPTSGRVTINEREIAISDNPRDLRKYGVGYVPEDRLNEGLIKNFPAYENVILGYHYFEKISPKRFLYPSVLQNLCRKVMEKYDIRPKRPNIISKLFSGGNQQKLILARELMMEPSLLIVAQPTRGVDIGSIEFIYDQLIQKRNAGTSILLISSELDEILALSDRILVMNQGKIVGELLGDTATEETVGALMLGDNV